MSQPKILISEDHPLAQQALVSTLKSLGHSNILMLANNTNAEALFEYESDFDILICTITTPYAPELELLRDVRKAGELPSLLVITDAAHDLQLSIQQYAKQLGYTILSILSKPYSKEHIEVALSSHVQRVQKDSAPLTTQMQPPKAVANGAHRGQFIPYFQPKLDLQTLEVVGAEILMRWHHPNLGILGPATFIDVARRFGHLDRMTISVLRQALTFLSTQTLGEHFKVAINIDAAQICAPDFYKKVVAILRSTKFNPSNLIIEITETGALRAPTLCLENLIHLRALGCGVSIDDFGAGLSSLQRVCELPCSEIKLDMSFTKALIENPRSVLAVECMAQLSKKMGTQLVAEGIETEEQLRILQKANCDIGQGYLFSPPVSGHKMVRWINHRQSQRLRKTK